MNFGTRGTLPKWWPAMSALVFILVAAAAAAHTAKPAGRIGEAAAMPQDVTRIESRLSQLEQRFYSIEASLRGIEQQSRLSGITTERATRDPEINLLRAEVEALRQRLAEAECGLARVDERTLSPAAKEARRKSAGAFANPCRFSPDSPLKFSARP